MAKKKTATETVQVRIRASERVYYDKTVEMSREEWERMKKTSASDLAKEIEPGGWLSADDISDSSGIDEDDFELEVVGDDGKPVKPADRFE